MNRFEFIENLTTALKGNISDIELDSQLKYYNNYINDEIEKGNNEEKILNELGDPKLIAKTIINLQKNNNIESEQYNAENSSNSNNEGPNYQNKQYKRYNTNSLGCALTAVVLIIILLSTLRLFSSLISGILYTIITIFGPIGIILIVLLVYFLFKNKNQ